MTKAKPCATCRHPKSSHRVGYCLRQTIKRGRPYMGMTRIVVECRCDGYRDRAQPSATAGGAG